MPIVVDQNSPNSGNTVPDRHDPYEMKRQLEESRQMPAQSLSHPSPMGKSKSGNSAVEKMGAKAAGKAAEGAVAATGVGAPVSKVAGKVTEKTAGAVLKAIHHIRWSDDWMVGVPLFFAISKDLLDFAGFSLPGINDALNLSIMGFTALVMAYVGSGINQRGKSAAAVKAFRKWIVIIAGTSLEELFGLNMLPIESVTVIVAYIMILLERAEAEQYQTA